MGNDTLQTVAAWLVERPELFTILYVPHSGGSPDYYVVRSLDDISRLLDRPVGGDLTLFRDQQFRIRGIVDDKFIERVEREFTPEQSWKVFRLTFYPDEVSLLGGGDGWEELRHDLEYLRGATVCAGPDPVLFDDQWDSVLKKNLRFPFLFLDKGSRDRIKSV